VSGFLYYNILTYIHNENLIVNFNNLKFTLSAIERDILHVFHLVDWANVNYSVNQFLDPDKNTQTGTGMNAIVAYDALNTYLFNTSISSYISKALIVATDNRTISAGLYPGTQNEASYIKGLPYFQKLLESDSYLWIGLENETFWNTTNYITTPVIPIARPIYKLGTKEQKGWIYIALSANILTERISERVDLNDAQHIWKVGSKYYIYEDNRWNEISDKWDFPPELQVKQEIFTTTDSAGRMVKIIGIDSDILAWQLIRLVDQTNELQVDFSKIIIPSIVLCFFISLFLYVMANMIIVHPIKRIERRIQHIASGDFSADPSIEGLDEIGKIGYRINEMSTNISTLMKNQLLAEKAKHDLELSNLQNQINPHFIYNTLNTIKWMAIIQQASGIVGVVDTMVSLLREIANDTRLHVTVRDELQFIDSYIKLLRFQYGETFSYQVFLEDKGLWEAEILKFTLQPIIENAIFHGLEPHERSGEISIRVGRNDGDLLITVFDNGAGMDSGQIRELFEANTTGGNVIKQLGVNNVNQRIKMEFGPSYGITIESIKGEYTKVFILYPLRSDLILKAENV
jgi:two-component system sensor histidine kinase YesM